MAKAMILAAGQGTRVRPLTKDVPKPMIPILGKPVLEYIIEHLASYGVKEIMINVAFMHRKIEEYFGDGHKFYNDTVGTYITNNFEVVDVGGDVKAARELRASMQALGETVAMGLDIEPVVGSIETKEAFTAEPGALQNRGRSKLKKWGRGGRNNSGGGLPGL